MTGRPIGWMLLSVVLGASGCASNTRLSWPEVRDERVVAASGHRVLAGPMVPAAPPSVSAARVPRGAMSGPVSLEGPRPVEVFIQLALAENRTVRAARFNVQAVRHRIPQATALDDPVLSNSIFPIPSVAPQYSLMGYMPYGALLAQQFPWSGTLRLRGQAAEQDLKIALFELAASELDVVAAVKKAYHDLAFAQRADTILGENRELAFEFVTIARQRYKVGSATQADVLRSETAVSDIDRERLLNDQNLAATRADLARLLHVDPETDLQAQTSGPVADVPGEVSRLAQLAVASRPELRGRLAAIERDQTAVELARKRFLPNVTLGVIYQDMEKTNAVTPKTAMGMPNVGLFVGMNLPIYRKKVAAGVCEAQARTAADVALYEAERDQAHRDVKDAFSQVRTQRGILDLLRSSNLPLSRQVFDAAAADYRAGNAGADYLGLLSAWRDVLQIELQAAQVEAELGKAMATLERAVGAQINEHPVDPAILTRPIEAAPGPLTPTGPAPAPTGEGPSTSVPAALPLTPAEDRSTR